MSLGQTRVFDQDVELVISQQARGVEIARADPDPAVIAHDGLGMKHRTIPFEDPDSAAQQIPVANAGEVPDQWHVAGAGNQQPDIHPVPSRVAQGLKQPGWRDQVSVGDPEPLHAAGGQQLDHPVGSLPPGLSADDPNLRLAHRCYHPGNLVAGAPFRRSAPRG